MSDINCFQIVVGTFNRTMRNPENRPGVQGVSQSITIESRLEGRL